MVKRTFAQTPSGMNSRPKYSSERTSFIEIGIQDADRGDSLNMTTSSVSAFFT